MSWLPTDTHLKDKPITFNDIPDGWSITLADGSDVKGRALSLEEFSEIRIDAPKDYYGESEIEYTVLDEAGNTSTGILALTVINVNDAPLLTSASKVEVNDNIDDQDTILTLTASDIDNKPEDIRYTIVKDASGLFELDSQTGEIRLVSGATLDAHRQESYTLTVQANDGTDASQIQEITLNVKDATAPRVESIVSALQDDGSIKYTFTFSEKVTDFKEESVEIEDAMASVKEGSLTSNAEGTQYSLLLIPKDNVDGSINIHIPAGKVHDTAGNANEASSKDDSIKVHIGNDESETMTLDGNNNGYDWISLKGGDDTLTLKETLSDETAIDFGVGYDSLLIDTSESIDLSNLSNLESMTLNSGSSADLHSIDIKDLIDDEHDTLIITDFDHEGDSIISLEKETVMLSQAKIQDSNKDGRIDADDATVVERTDSKGDTYSYDQYTSADGSYYIEIEQSLTLEWQ